MAWVLGLRYLRLGATALELLARDDDVALSHPLLAAEVWSAVAVAAPLGFRRRAHGMSCLVGDLLTPEIMSRRTKAQFDEVFWTDRAREFVGRWGGDGVPDEWVDRFAIARHWAQRHPLAQSFTLLQFAWLHEHSPGRLAGSTEREGVQRMNAGMGRTAIDRVTA